MEPISFAKWSLIKRKMVRSPTTAPIPAIRPISTGESVSARMRRIKAPVATVKVETNNIPAMNAPRYPSVPKLSKNVWKAVCFERISVKRMLKSSMVRFLYFQDLQWLM